MTLYLDHSKGPTDDMNNFDQHDVSHLHVIIEAFLEAEYQSLTSSMLKFRKVCLESVETG